MLSPRQIALQGFSPVDARLVALQGFGDAAVQAPPAKPPISLYMSVGGAHPTHRERADLRRPAKDPRVERNNQIILMMALAVVSGKIKR